MQSNLFLEQKSIHQRSGLATSLNGIHASRNRLQRMMGGALLTCSLLLSLCACAANKTDAQESEAFSYAWLKGQAHTLATQPYVSHKGELPKSLQGMSWDDYQQFHFKKKAALWREQNSEF
ncbi:glucan biosynthesis protein, partial [Shewanella sp.]|uniref:glucan biosynthesis protein n=1 Tax=Shewanella sp. TaxID=50422 RepID=UPI003F36C8E5